MIVAQYFIAFIFFSFIGWIYECIYCTAKDKRWENRGFLFGPICPIYGFSVVLAMLIFGHLPALEDKYKTPVWQIFIICAVLSAVIEYVTSYVLERLFHAIWWDYSEVPLNLNGRICLPATCGFGIAGVLVVRFLLPFMASLPMNEHPLRNEVLALIFMFLLGIDITVTVASLTDMLERMENIQTSFDKRMQAGYELAVSGPVAVVNAAKNSAIVAKRELSENVSEYMKTASLKDRHHLRNIKSFRSVKNRITAEKIVEAFRLRFKRPENEK
ncbi:MAG: putative ABC transporter permease [Lachnospiraceae bacterium]|nr:putative ABC transporter permease [Lachnospiraceae bacterium]